MNGFILHLILTAFAREKDIPSIFIEFQRENPEVFSFGDESLSLYVRTVSADTSPTREAKYPSDQKVRSLKKHCDRYEEKGAWEILVSDNA